MEILGPLTTEAVEQSAAPRWVRAALERLVEADPGTGDRMEEQADLAAAVVAVLGASRSLTRLVEVRTEESLATLADLDHPVLSQAPLSGDPADLDDLVHSCRQELLRISARDLLGIDALEATGEALAQMASAALQVAWRSAVEESGASGRLAVVGMGKLGGHELNYSSDVDLVLVGEGDHDELEATAKRLFEIARRCFRVDADLRPEGRNGPLVRSIASYDAYWERWAEPWEFQALLKASPVAGDAQLGAEWAEVATRRLWSRPLGADDLRSLRDMKRRAENEVARRGLAERELKRGPGGIRDIEFTAQLLQLVHGHADPDLRSPNTLELLEELSSAGYVDAADSEALGDSYRFLRCVEHRLQLLDEHQVHTLPTDDATLDRIGRTLGLRDTADGTAAEHLRERVRREQRIVRSVHERVYFRPLLEAFAGTTGGMSPEAAAERLTAFGFTDALRTQAAVRELTRGLNRSSRLMQQMLPLLLDWLSRSPDPDLGVLMLRNLLGERSRAATITAAFRDSAVAAQRLCDVVGTSRLVGDIVMRNPDLVARLDDPARLRTRARDELVMSARSTTSWREAGERQEALRRWKERHLFGIAARDVLGESDVETVGRDLSALAEASIESALADVGSEVPLAVIGLGRLGGEELSYASDLDVIFAFEQDGHERAAEAQRAANAVMRALRGATPAQRVYEVDAALRPEGRGGPVARSIESYVLYWQGYAQTWERLAMVRARPVAGDLELGGRLLATLSPYVWEGGLAPDELLEVRRMKARIEAERIPPGEDPQFHLKLGRGSLSDVEFTVQMLQLRHGIRSTSTIAAIELLQSEGILSEEDAEVLATSYRFCELVRDRWYLVGSPGTDSLPMQPEALAWLARSLGTSPSQLREQYRRVTRRARRVVEHELYGGR